MKGAPEKPETGKTSHSEPMETNASPIQFKGDGVLLGTWKITRYYTPVKGQNKYFNGSYAKDYKINCQGDCLVTADGTHLDEAMEYKVAACPPNMKFGDKLYIEKIGVLTCHDRGGAIKGKRLDVWAGIGEKGLQNIYDRPETSGYHKIYKIN